MSKCTAAEALAAFEYWLGYYEKASAAYVKRRDKEVFALDKGSANYTYMGYLCGIQGGAWCAMMVSTAIYEACGGSKADAKGVLWNLWPYARCDMLYDAAPSGSKGRRDAWTPKPGDVIVFGYTSRDHTGMVYAVDEQYVYTYEGNSSNMCKKRSYPRNSAWIWGYVRPNYKAGAEPEIPAQNYGAVCVKELGLHELSKGTAGPEVASAQALLKRFGFNIDVDGEFGGNTKAAVVAFQAEHKLVADGIIGRKTWEALLRYAK